MMHRFILLVLVLIIELIFSLPDRPQFPTKEVCELYKIRCQEKLQLKNCKERSEECVLYAENGLNVTWSFCKKNEFFGKIFQFSGMYANEDNIHACRQRILIDYEIIKNVIQKNQFNYVPI
ncbi:hypothetical protein WR25_11754 isoform E [Diploscapter pachys]|uniref:Uncharacterized protein n=1 Tax=Diploscapter pachys TaxID=2018661 RepID=A0A2A2JWZ6_9BILA|nr:hypothetical protein WR25_11754 isoform C [Diploscapter pachys]PAV66204.1 hypothetical protein WR25_11754 isoform E [Diploscapter pachys]